jgi:hypothetical protein
MVESVKMAVANLPEILQKEWECVVGYYSSETDTVFEEFKKRYDNFEGTTIEELLAIPKVVYTEWNNWKYRNGYETTFNTDINERGWKVKSKVEKSLTQVFNQFKEFWQYDSEESKVMFKEMEHLSEKMNQEWRLKYNFVYPHVYERDNNHYSCYHLKSKAQLWEEFKEIWEIEISDYNENKYNEMIEYISEIECDSENYFKEYPQNFFDFRENANYHSFYSYSVLEQFEICEDWDHYRDIEDTDSDDSDEIDSDEIDSDETDSGYETDEL